MALLSDSWLVDIALAVVTLFTSLYLFFTTRYKYWENRKIPYVKPEMFFGNLKPSLLGSKNMFEVHEALYKELKSQGKRFGGFFEMHLPNLMIVDPSLAYRIMVKDFVHFYNRGTFPVDVKNDPLTNNLTSLEGHDWRQLRYKLTPTFSTGKLKGMFDQIHNCVEHLLKELKKYSSSGEAIEARDVMSIFTTDVIASCAFGLQFKPNSPEGEPFKRMVGKVFPNSKFGILRTLMKTFSIKLSNILGVTNFPKDVSQYFLNLSKETIQYRKENGVKRKDFLQLMMQLQDNKDNKKIREEEISEEDAIVDQLDYSTDHNSRTETKDLEITDECIAASSFMFLVAGTEVAVGLGFTLYRLAINPSMQERLQQEVDLVTAKHGYTFQALKEMVYMDLVIQETLRLHSVAGLISRVCTMPYKIPDTDIVLEKGTRITIPLLAFHRDPENYPDPEKFDPERFVGNNFKPSPTYLPFGDGPRICIAMRFIIMEMKICLARVMSQFTVTLNKKTLQPLQLEKSPFVVRALGGIWINFHDRTSRQ